MTTILKKSSNDTTVQVLRHPDGAILITPIRLLCVPDEALILGVSVIGTSLSYTPRMGAHAVQVELASHDEAKAVLAMIGQMLAEAPQSQSKPAPGVVPPVLTGAMSLHGAPIGSTESAFQDVDAGASVAPDHLAPNESAPSNTGTRRARFISWVRGEGCWRRRLAFMSLAAFSFWLFYPEDTASVAPLSFNAPPVVVTEAPSGVALSPAPSPYANDPLAVGLNPESTPSTPKESGASAQKPVTSGAPAASGVNMSTAEVPQGANQPYVFKPKLVRPSVDVPALNCK